MNYDLVLFDLDGTLIDEREYLDGVYSQIASDLNDEYGENVYEVYRFLTDTFINEGRERLFDKLCEKYKLPEEEIRVMLFTLRTARVELNIYPGILPILRDARNVAICTDGNPQQQRNKIRCAGLQKYKVYHTHKPDAGGLSFPGALMIGDSPIDREFAENVGADFINSLLYTR